MGVNPVLHLELHSGDGASACAFLSAVTGWRQQQIEAGDRSYLALDMGGGLGGGIVECSTPRALWLPYVEVPSVCAATERARNLGADVLLEPREGAAGFRSVVATPAAGDIAFWQHKR